jgi:hypothetical protein
MNSCSVLTLYTNMPQRTDANSNGERGVCRGARLSLPPPSPDTLLSVCIHIIICMLLLPPSRAFSSDPLSFCPYAAPATPASATSTAQGAAATPTPWR